MDQNIYFNIYIGYVLKLTLFDCMLYIKSILQELDIHKTLAN